MTVHYVYFFVLQCWKNDDCGRRLLSQHLRRHRARNPAAAFGAAPWIQQHHQQQWPNADKGRLIRIIHIRLFSNHWTRWREMGFRHSCVPGMIGGFVFFWSWSVSFQLRAPVHLNSYVSIALLPRQGATLREGRVCRVSGWGYTSPSGGQIPATLRTVKLPIIATEKCNSSQSFNGNVTENMLCAGYSAGGKDACQVNACPLSSCLRCYNTDASVSTTYQSRFTVSDCIQVQCQCLFLFVSGGLRGSACVWGPCLRPGVLGERVCWRSVPWSVHRRVQLPAVDRQHYI